MRPEPLLLVLALVLAGPAGAEVRLEQDPAGGGMLARVTPPSRLEDVAQAAYGDPGEWRRIYAANQAQLARPAAGGVVTLRVPPRTQPAPQPRPRAQGGGFLEALLRILAALMQVFASAGAGSSAITPTPLPSTPGPGPGPGPSWIGGGVLGSGNGSLPGSPAPGTPTGAGGPTGTPAPATPGSGPAPTGGTRFRVWATSEEPQETASGIYMSASTVAAALPDRSALRRRLRVHYKGRTLDMPVIDLGPWNIRDPYWQTGSKPRAQTAHETGGRDDMGRRPSNPAGIDLSWAAWKQLGIASPSNHSDWVEWEWID